jgi:hypothetical protein
MKRRVLILGAETEEESKEQREEQKQKKEMRKGMRTSHHSTSGTPSCASLSSAPLLIPDPGPGSLLTTPLILLNALLVSTYIRIYTLHQFIVDSSARMVIFYICLYFISIIRCFSYSHVNVIYSYLLYSTYHSCFLSNC